MIAGLKRSAETNVIDRKPPALAAMMLVGWLAAASLGGCEAERTCGEGAELKDGTCELKTPVTCGAGTVLEGDKCVATADGTGGSDAGATDTAGGTDAGSTDAGSPDSGGSGVDSSGPVCQPICSKGDKPCGEDGCGGSCGTCSGDLVCTEGTCQPLAKKCVPFCVDLVCGDDGCGGSCGTCPGGSSCDKGKCVEKCVPDCIGKSCGDDGCKGTCGTCGAKATCSKAQLCIAKGWTCDPYRYGNDGFCDCDCGADDPDCDNTVAPVLGCAPYTKCTAGKCESLIPKAWTCLPAEYDDGINCNCGCGAPDPDCAKGGTGDGGCKTGQKCDATGKCGKCVADCKGKTCGPDGCGGLCGGCPGPTKANPAIKPMACIGGKCVDGCLPAPLLCKTNSCGDDGCGSSCGSCKNGEFCSQGQCKVKPGMSCKGYCKGKAPAGCSCTFGCEKNGNCCPDYAGTCVCKPNCKGRVCGSDGCGGICGTCAKVKGKPHCNEAGQCQATCAPICTGKSCGADGCGGSCGTCKGGAKCNSDDKCVPPEWTCLSIYYADGSLCDCSCGAPDPDCKSVALTAGCPNLASCQPTTGICKMSFCAHNGECKAPQWCIGHYPIGKGLSKGICALPNPQAKAEGTFCITDSTCASGLCLSGACRDPCQEDKHCAAKTSCVAITPPQGLAGMPKPAVAACYSSVVLGAACKKAADCKSGDVCQVFAHPTTLKPMHHCAPLLAPEDESAKCTETAQCRPGLLCAKGACRRPCPGGPTDCPAKHSCSPAVLHHGALIAASDDVKVNACTPVTK